MGLQPQLIKQLAYGNRVYAIATNSPILSKLSQIRYWRKLAYRAKFEPRLRY